VYKITAKGEKSLVKTRLTLINRVYCLALSKTGSNSFSFILEMSTKQVKQIMVASKIYSLQTAFLTFFIGMKK